MSSLHAMEKKLARSSITCLSDPPGRDQVIVGQSLKITGKKGVHLGPPNDGKWTRGTRAGLRLQGSQQLSWTPDDALHTQSYDDGD
jgi:hypothetical protein